MGLEDDAGDSKAHRRAHRAAMAGGAIVVLGGLSLGLLGLFIVGAHMHDSDAVLIPLGAIAFTASALSFVGAFAALNHENYSLAITGSATPATVFLGGCVIALVGESNTWTVFLLLGLIGAMGTLLVTMSRKAFSVG